MRQVSPYHGTGLRVEGTTLSAYGVPRKSGRVKKAGVKGSGPYVSFIERPRNDAVTGMESRGLAVGGPVGAGDSEATTRGNVPHTSSSGGLQRQAATVTSTDKFNWQNRLMSVTADVPVSTGLRAALRGWVRALPGSLSACIRASCAGRQRVFHRGSGKTCRTAGSGDPLPAPREELRTQEILAPGVCVSHI